MYKKIILIIILFLISGCSIKNIENMSLEENIDYVLKQNIKLHNVNNKGYRYYLPASFSILDNKDYNHVLLSNGVRYYLNIDVVSYYNKNLIGYTNTKDAYKYIVLKNKDKNGYLKIIKNNDNFLVEIVYNYAIIELQVKENNLKESIINSMFILTSIVYNDSMIKNNVGEKTFESAEDIYNIFKPKDSDPKNFLHYVQEYDRPKENTGYSNISDY